MGKQEEINAVVTSVFPQKIRIEVKNIEDFKIANEKLAVGSYLRISDNDDCAIMAVIENFNIEKIEGSDERKYVLEALPIGFIDDEGHFTRGGNNIAIPPIDVKPASNNEIQKIYDQIEPNRRFCFSSLAQNESIRVPVDGDRFFNKHIAIVGSTGSGKSFTLASILQQATRTKEGSYTGLNNSHIILFDLHGEYKTAFPLANHLDVSNLTVPYWLMNGEELEEVFVESGEFQAYNQISLLRRTITRNKQKFNENDRIIFDTPAKFSIKEVLNCITNLSIETCDYNDIYNLKIVDNAIKVKTDEEKLDHYFKEIHQFEEPQRSKIKKGTYNDGTLEKFISRIKTKISDERLSFLFGENADTISFNETLRHVLGYKSDAEANITVIDLSGVPFEVLSTTVSLISRIVFEHGYYYKRVINPTEDKAPILVVYEEAHKYVPKVQSAKYNSSRIAIERIAKEGRKYGVTLVIVTQRPSEISETIFSQCNNFVTMRLTNPEDQNYVKRLLPDNLGPLTESLPVLEAGKAILIGDALIMPSLVTIDCCNPAPSSGDVDYLQEWKKEWLELEFDNIISAWRKK
jgi:hypothetical protein